MKNLNRNIPIRVAVIGNAFCDRNIYEIAFEVGYCIGFHGGIVITGGRGGVMRGASEGAIKACAVTIGILPGTDPADANEFVTIPIATGLGHARNAVIAQCADAVIAIAGSYGTLSEISLALKIGKPVFGIRSWPFENGVIQIDTPEEAVKRIFGE
ncbi:TIGR00725 family protein [bacterium]|nr:TIGR00725 family protein [bacterium]